MIYQQQQNNNIMKNQEQIESRIEKIQKRINDLWVRYDEAKSEFIFNQIQSLQKEVNLLCWTLGKEEIF